MIPYTPLTLTEFTGHPKPLANAIEAARIDREILHRADKTIEEALKFANDMRLSGQHHAKAVHDLAQLLGAVARNDRKPISEVTEL